MLRWADGELIALDHEDIEGELALGALGGQQMGCALVVSAWRTALQDPRLLTLASRGRSDPLAIQPFDGVVAPSAFSGAPRRARGPRRMRSAQMFAAPQPAPFPTVAPGYGSAAFAVSAGWVGQQPEKADPLVSVLKITALRDRLLRGAILAWSSRVAEGTVSPDAQPTLAAALIGRLSAVARDWLGDPKATIDVSMLPPGSSPIFRIDREGMLQIGAPFSWLADVWAAELSMIYGRLTLAAQIVGRTVTLDTVGPDLTRAPIVIRLP
jgi:hypothetical protein